MATNYTNLKTQITNAIGRYNNTYKKTSNKNENPSIAIRNLIRKLPAVNQSNYMERLNTARAAVEPNYVKNAVKYYSPTTSATAATSSRPLPPPPPSSRPLPPPPPPRMFTKSNNKIKLNPNGTVPHLSTIIPQTHTMSVAKNNGTPLGSFTAKVFSSKGGFKKYTHKSQKSQKRSKRTPKSLKRIHK